MSHDAQHPSKKIDIATKRKLDRIASDFEDDWCSQPDPLFDRFLGRIEEEYRSELLKHLLEVDLELRVSNGLPIKASDYLQLGQSAVKEAEVLIAELHKESEPGLRKNSNGLSGSDSNRSLQGSQAEHPRQPASSFSPQEIGPYKLLRQIGEGGMGEVWLAEQEIPVRRRVAIKVIRSDIGSQEAVARFEAERQALAMMDHSNIAKVLDAGTTAHGRPYVVMELVMGVPITEYCNTNKLSIRERLNLFVPVCQAIQHAHQKGIIHRDIKPSNILVTLSQGSPTAKVIDFGLAKALEGTAKLTERTMFTEFGKVVGTLQYMSPEQAEMNALDVDTRTDVYSLGIVLYELLVGSTPLDKKSVSEKPLFETLSLIREQEAIRPSTRLNSAEDVLVSKIGEQRRISPAKLRYVLRGELDWVVMKALEKDRTRRYETANHLGEEILAFLNDEPVKARPPSTTYRMLKAIRKHRSIFVTTTVVLVAIVVAASVSFWSAIKSQQLGTELKLKNANLIRTVEELQLANAREKKAKDKAIAAEKIAAAEKLTAEGILSFFENDLLRSVDPWDSYQSTKQQDLLTLPVYEVLNTAAQKFSVENFAQSKLTPSAYIGIMIAIADVYEGLGDLKGAEKHARGAYRIAQDVFGEEHPKTAEALVNLAFVYLANSKPAEATTCILRSYESVERAVMAEHKRTLEKDEPTADAAVVTKAVDTKAVDTKAVDTKAVDTVARQIVRSIFETVKKRLDYGHNSLPVWNRQSIGLANTLKLSAIALRYPKLLKRMEEQFGKDDEYFGYARMIQGFALHGLGQVNNAKEIYESVFHFVKQKVNSGQMAADDIAALGIRQLLAETYEQLKIEPGKQVEYSQQVVKLMESRYGQSHPGTVLAKGFCAAKMVVNDRAKDAIPLLQDVLNTTEYQLGATHLETVQATTQLGFALRKVGLLEQSLQVFETRFDVLESEEVNSRVILKLVPGFYELAQQFLERKPDVAVKILQRCFEVESKHSPDHWSTFDTQSLLGESQLKSGDLAKAKRNLETGFQGLKMRLQKIPRKDREYFFQESIRRLIQLAVIQKDQMAEMKWRAILAESESKPANIKSQK